ALLVCSYRDDEVGTRHPTRQLLGDLAHATTVHRMHVPPLSLAAVSELAGASEVDPVKLHQRTGGNPFFVVEVLAGNGAGVPDRAGDAVMARVARLSHDAAEVLEMLSLSTHGAAPGLVNGLVDNGDALDECVAAGLLESRAGHLVFRHDIAREAVAGSVSPGKRQ